MAPLKGSKNKSTAPASIDQARKMARIKAIDAAPLWGLDPVTISLRCRRKEIPEAKQLGSIWYVTPGGMDRLFEGGKKR